MKNIDQIIIILICLPNHVIVFMFPIKITNTMEGSYVIILLLSISYDFPWQVNIEYIVSIDQF